MNATTVARRSNEFANGNIFIGCPHFSGEMECFQKYAKSHEKTNGSFRHKAIRGDVTPIRIPQQKNIRSEHEYFATSDLRNPSSDEIPALTKPLPSYHKSRSGAQISLEPMVPQKIMETKSPKIFFRVTRWRIAYCWR